MEVHERSKPRQKYAALILGGCNLRTHSRSVAVLCTAGADIIAALDSVHCMIAAKRRARGADGLSAQCLSFMTRLGSMNEPRPGPDVLVGSFVAENRSVFRARLTLLHRPHADNGQKALIRMLLPNASLEELQESHLGCHRTVASYTRCGSIVSDLNRHQMHTGQISLSANFEVKSAASVLHSGVSRPSPPK